MVASRDSILELLKNKGPMVPNEVKKALGGDTIIIGAMLAELSSRKIVKISHLKRGGSPFYYLEGQENLLENCIQFLSDKDKSIVEFLKSNKVVQDNKLELYQRAALRQLKDFAKEFKANTANGEVLFWRYYLISEQEVVDILNERFAPKPAPVEEATPQQTLDSVGEKEVEAEEVSVVEPVVESVETVEEVQNEMDTAVETVEEKELEETPVLTKVEENGIEVEVPETSSVKENEVESKPVEEVQKTETEVEPEIETTTESNVESIVEPESDDDCEEVVEKVYEEITETDLEETEFYLLIKNYFEEKSIKVYEETQLSKDKEYEFTIGLNSSIGELKMLCRCRNKKRLNESDVAPALLRAKSRDQFLLFLTPGEFTKKSKLLMSKEYKGLTIEQLN